MTERETLALLRFLRAGAHETAVLNDGPAAEPGPCLAERLVEAAVALHRAPGARSLASVEAVAAELVAFDYGELRARNERLAFWVNVYNALAVHAVARLGVRQSVREAAGFFHRAAYCIGGQRYDLDAIEHGVLRANRPPLPGLPPPFAPDDPRLAAVVLPPDARVHLALHCATRSCPPLRAYHAATLDADLDRAAHDFVAAGVELSDSSVRLAAIFDLYRDDFGGRDGVRAVVLAHLPAELPRDVIADAFAGGRIVYDPYDWSLATV